MRSLPFSIAMLVIVSLAADPAPASSHSYHAEPSAAALIPSGDPVAAALDEPCGTCEAASETVCQETFNTSDCHQFEYDLGDDDRGMDSHTFLSDGNVGGLGECSSNHPACDVGLRMSELQDAVHEGDAARFVAALAGSPGAYVRLDSPTGQLVVYAACWPEREPTRVVKLRVAAAFIESWQQAQRSVEESRP
jgi:hypothetical protein